MNRVVVSAAVALAAVVGVMLNMQQVVSADQASVVNNSGLTCGIFAGEAGGLGEIVLQIENEDKVMMKCKGTDLPNPTGTAQSADGFLCGAMGPNGVIHETEDSHATVSASGVGTMTCTYHKQ